MTSSLWIAVGMAVVATAVALAFLPRRTATVRDDRVTGTAVDHRHMALGVVMVAVVALATLGCASSDSSDAAARPATTTAATRHDAPAPSTTSAVRRPTTARDELVPVAGGQLHIRCAGEGDTTVVLIAGFEANADIWTAVTPDLESETRVCAYDRFGTGTSSPPPERPDVRDPGRRPPRAAGCRRRARSLRRRRPLLRRCRGGDVRLDVRRRGRRAAPAGRQPGHWPDTACAVVDDGSEVAASFQATCAMFDPDGNIERLDAHAAFDLVAEIDSLGDVPMIVAPAAERPYPGLAEAEATRLRAAWDAGQAHWASLSTASEVVPVADTGHNIQVDQPGIVVDLIQRLLR